MHSQVRLKWKTSGGEIVSLFMREKSEREIKNHYNKRKNNKSRKFWNKRKESKS
jgi:hypothetical protein